MTIKRTETFNHVIKCMTERVFTNDIAEKRTIYSVHGPRALLQ